jgi:glycosyltransferase involved in cell wall biosynthesis
MISGEYRDALRVVASEPMRILQVIPTYLPATRYGGPIVGVHALARALIARGHDVEVVTTNVNGAGASPVPLGTRVEIDSVPVRYFASPWLERLCFAPAMASVLRAEMSQFDIAHLHSVFLWPTYAAVGAAQAAKVPYVVSPRGMLVGDLIRRRNRLVKSAWIALFERSNLECGAAIHATSRTEAAELDRFRWRLPPVTVIPNGVATDDGNDCVGTDVSSDAGRSPPPRRWCSSSGASAGRKGRTACSTPLRERIVGLSPLSGPTTKA